MGDLFIVDNGDKNWKVENYLHEWADLAHAFDVATGYFEIGALLALDGQWQKLDKLRILMGDEVSKRTKDALLAGIETVLDDEHREEKGEGRFPLRCPCHRGCDAEKADRVPGLRQEEVPRQGVHNPRPAGGRGIYRARRIEQLHRTWPDRQHRTQHPDAPRGRAFFRNGTRTTGTKART